MKKVLLVYDDFNEMTLIQSTLGKLGFDVVGISNEYLLGQKLLEFSPEMVVTSGSSTKVNAISVSAKLKENRKYSGKVMVILPAKVRPNSSDLLKMRMDAVLEAPVPPEVFISSLAPLMEQDKNLLLEKLRKFSNILTPKEFKGAAQESEPTARVSLPPVAKSKMDKYETLTQAMKFDTSQSLHRKALVKEKQKEMAKDWDPVELEAQDKLKREFATALFDPDLPKKDKT